MKTLFILSQNTTFSLNITNEISPSGQFKILVLEKLEHLQEYLADEEAIALVHHSVFYPKRVHELGGFLKGLKTLLVLPKGLDVHGRFPTNLMFYHLIFETELPSQLIVALSSMQSGAHYFCPYIGKHLARGRESTSSPSEFGLTPRMIEVLNGVLSGKSYDQIGEELCVSGSTVKKHLESIRIKLKLDSPRQIVDFLRKAHWCDFRTGDIIHF